MDNQLIFWYRQSSVPDEAGDANHLKPLMTDPFGVRRGGGAWDPIR